jgi:hypothetical protein
VTYARAIAASCVPLQLWWSLHDRIVLDQRQQTGALYKQIMAVNPDAPVEAFIGYWNHSAEMQARTRLPAALANFDLLPSLNPLWTAGLRYVQPPYFERGCVKPTPPWTAKASALSHADAG